MPQLSRRSEDHLLKTINGTKRKEQPKPGSMTHQLLHAAFPSRDRDEEQEAGSRRTWQSPVRSSKPAFRHPSPLPSSNPEDTMPPATEFNPPPMASSDDELLSPEPSRGRNADMKTTTFTARSRTNRRQPSPPVKRTKYKRHNASGQTASPGVDVLASEIPTRDSSLSELSEDNNDSGLPSLRKKRTVARYGKKGTRAREQAKPAFQALSYDSSQSPQKKGRPGLLVPPGSSPAASRTPLRTAPSEHRSPTKLNFNPSDESDPEVRALMRQHESNPEPKPEPKRKRTKRSKHTAGTEDNGKEKAKFVRDKPEFKAFSSSDDELPLRAQSSSPVKVAIEDLSELSELDDLSKPIREDSDAELQRGSVCPWCGEEVSEVLLQRFTKGRTMNVGMQTKFCRLHKRDAACTLWRERQYPKINWDDLPSRLSQQHDYILEIIDGKVTHHRALLAEKIESGYGRKLREDENLNPGYYGPRGFNIMCDYLTNHFGELLKEKAISDRVIAGRGTVAFIQVVLVPDLAIVLIKEDMRVNERKAVGILDESKALGDILCEDVQ